MKRNEGRKEFGEYILRLLRENKSHYTDIFISSFVINILAITVSLFAMQVYDTVIPSASYSTLFVLITGAIFFLAFDFLFKLLRNKYTANIIQELDTKLSGNIFDRLLQVKFSELNVSIGVLSAQLKSYESLRSFLTSSLIYTIPDTPFILIFLILIVFISGPIFALIILIFISLMFINSFISRILINRKLKHSINSNYERSGYLFEIVSNFESIKAIGNYKFFNSKWKNLCRVSINDELALRKITETSLFLNSLLQQLMMISIISTGAYYVSQYNMSLGGLVAVSILAGRLMNPICVLPNLIASFSTVKATINIFNRIYSLKTDNVISNYKFSELSGLYDFDNVKYEKNGKIILDIPSLKINSKESVAVFGPIGSGKSSLLRLLSGVINPSAGKIMLDNLNLSSYNSKTLSCSIGYLPQDCKVFEGTLKENLLFGNEKNINDKHLFDLSIKTGLIDMVKDFPDGFDQQLNHDGNGISGGQKQLVLLTRIFLLDPDILILDEPTSSLDSVTEKKIQNIINDLISNGKKVIISTHKVDLITSFHRVIILNNSKILLNGEKNWVFNQLQNYHLKK